MARVSRHSLQIQLHCYFELFYDAHFSQSDVPVGPNTHMHWASLNTEEIQGLPIKQQLLRASTRASSLLGE